MALNNHIILFAGKPNKGKRPALIGLVSGQYLFDRKINALYENTKSQVTALSQYFSFQEIFFLVSKLSLSAGVTVIFYITYNLFNFEVIIIDLFNNNAAIHLLLFFISKRLTKKYKSVSRIV